MGYKTHNNITIFPIEVYKLIPGEIGHFTTKCTWGVESNPENGWQSITYHQKMTNFSKKTIPLILNTPPETMV